AVFPGTQGGPLMNQIAGKAQAFFEASQPAFKEYAQTVIDNAKVMVHTFHSNGIQMSTNGTDSHIILIHTGDKT
ncbi:MAG TPA: serine hydroxymethyltransferase, partial [Balneolaceae bacterium]|nr:serine hydroxymethyltransferase [Balneolaceae bacterium]